MSDIAVTSAPARTERQEDADENGGRMRGAPRRLNSAGDERTRLTMRESRATMIGT
jgi:hypothetical protein